MIVQHNIPALNTFRNNGINGNSSAKALEKLSSGLKINRAGDDAAGLAISEKMRAQVRGLNRASENCQDGVSLIQSADGALNEVHAILHRMRELSIQAGNDVNEQIDRKAIQDEINQLTKEIDRISTTTEFNKMTVLDGSLQNGKYIKLVSGQNISGVGLMDPQVAVNGLTSISTIGGAAFDMTFDMAFPANVDPHVQNGVIQDSGVSTLMITISEDIAMAAGLNPDNVTYAVAINAGDTAAVIAGNIRDMLANALGADWNVIATGSQLNVTHKFVGDFSPGIEIIAGTPGDEIWESSGGEWNTDGPTANVKGTQGRDLLVVVDGEDADFSGMTTLHDWPTAPEEGYLRGRDTVLNLSIGEYDPEQVIHRNQFTFKIDDATVNAGAIIGTMFGSELALQVGANTGYAQSVRINIGSLNAKSLGVAELNMFSHKDAQNAIGAVDLAVQKVSDQRAGLGAVQNRLEHTIANVDTVSENLQDAESRLRDTDMAKEMMNFTRASILLQSSQAMLAQANNLPQGVLQLLR